MSVKPRKVLYLQYTNPGAYPPLMQSARLFAEAGWQVSLLGVRTAFIEDLQIAPHANMKLRLLTTAASGWRLKLAYLRYCLSALWMVCTLRPDWVYLSDPMVSPLGCLLMRFGKRCVLYHEHDAPPPAAAANGFMAFVLRCRLLLARRAPIVVVPNQDRGLLLQAEAWRTEPVFCVWNCPHSSEAQLPKPAPAEGADFWLLYQGSINRLRLPAALIAALAQTPPAVKLCIAGYETPGNVGALQALFDLAEKHGVRERLHYAGNLSRPALLQRIRQCDLGLALFVLEGEDPNFRHMAGASNKVFDYLACGVPALAADSPDWVALIQQHQLGFVCDPLDAGDIAKQLAHGFEQRQQLWEMGERGRQKILSQWNYECAFAPVLAEIERRT